MTKQFFDVFPTLKVNSDCKVLFENVEVTKVTTNSDRDYLHVHLFSTHLLAKSWIYKMETMIKEQLFGRNRIRIRIYEDYQLSGQYTPENLMNEYRESILLELKERSVVEHNMFLNAKYHFENENHLYLKLDDTIVAQGKQDSIVGLLNEVFEERCHVPIQIHVEYQQAKTSKMQEHNARILQQAINAIVEENAAKLETKETKEEVKQEKKEQKETAKTSAKAPAKEMPKKKEFYRPLKRSDDPNLIYGRDFEDETIELSQVVGEMGEITFRGQVTSFDTREIRNEKTIVMFAVTDFTDTIMVKLFVRNDQLPELLGEVKAGAFLKIKGVTTIDKFDSELTIGSVAGIKKIPDFRTTKKDTSAEKRVELHCHTTGDILRLQSRITVLCRHSRMRIILSKGLIKMIRSK